MTRGNSTLTNALRSGARFWCSLKRFGIVLIGILFTFFLFLSISSAFKEKDENKRKEKLTTSMVLNVCILFAILVYWFYGTEYGCYLGAARNAYHFVI